MTRIWYDAELTYSGDEAFSGVVTEVRLLSPFAGGLVRGETGQSSGSRVEVEMDYDLTGIDEDLSIFIRPIFGRSSLQPSDFGAQNSGSPRYSPNETGTQDLFARAFVWDTSLLLPESSDYVEMDSIEFRIVTDGQVGVFQTDVSYVFGDAPFDLPVSHMRAQGDDTDETVTGQAGDDEIRGGGGDDALSGMDGDDLLDGGAGGDELRGGADDDRLFGGDGQDMMEGGAGRDRLFGGAGRDTADGGDGVDRLLGGGGGDRLDGGGEDDVLLGQGGTDVLRGGAGDDRLRGDARADAGLGGAGDDDIDGGHGRDRLFGQDGDDRLTGGRSNDRLVGGEGADRFVFSKGAGRDLVMDFESGEDLIEIGRGARSFARLEIDEGRDGAVVSYGLAGDMIVLRGVEAASLSAGDFVFDA